MPSAAKAATRKKPARKKAPQAKAEKKPDEALKADILAHALKDAAFDGFTPTVLEKAGKAAGASAAELARLFENGPLDLIAYYSQRVDDEMATILAGQDLTKRKTRERIALAVLTRLALLRPHKEAARRAAALLSLPMHAALGARLIYRSVDAMWRAAGDTATDFNFYTKRGILAGVYGATLVFWFNDQSQDESATGAFLAARIENVMQFEKLKARAKAALAAWPDFARPRAKSKPAP